jgi:hypothetical protein
VTTSGFLTRWPEFGSLSIGIVQSFIADAATHVDATTWGTTYDLAHGLTAADALWTSEHGSSLRRDAKEGARSPYALRLASLRRQKMPKAMVL